MASQIVNEGQPEQELLPRALAMALAMAGKDRKTRAALERGLHAEALVVLEAGSGGDT